MVYLKQGRHAQCILAAGKTAASRTATNLRYASMSGAYVPPQVQEPGGALVLAKETGERCNVSWQTEPVWDGWRFASIPTAPSGR